MEKQYLAVDMGSSSGKILLAELTKQKRIQMREAGRFITPRVFLRGHVCINVYEVYEKICGVLEKLGREGRAPASLGIDSWAGDFGIVNPQGELLGLPVFYRDRRTAVSYTHLRAHETF